jgi:hypothetical protein
MKKKQKLIKINGSEMRNKKKIELEKSATYLYIIYKPFLTVISL